MRTALLENVGGSKLLRLQQSLRVHSGSHDALNPPMPALASPQPTFGSNQNVPFLFQPTHLPQTPQSHPWAPPPQFSISKAFPPQADVKDVDMTEASPFRNEDTKGDESPAKEKDHERPVAGGALRRVYRQRTNRPYTRRRREHEGGEASSGSDSEDEASAGPLTRKTSNHYTLNMPAHPAPQSDLPYILLGYVNLGNDRGYYAKLFLAICSSSSTYP